MSVSVTVDVGTGSFSTVHVSEPSRSWDGNVYLYNTLLSSSFYAKLSGGNEFVGNQVISGSVFISGSLQVGSSSVIVSSQTSSMTVLSSSYAITSSFAQTASYAGNYTLLSEFRPFTASYQLASSSISTRLTNLEYFSSSLDNTFITDAELNAATASLSSSIALLSSSYEQFSASYNTGSFTGSFTGLLYGTASWSNNSTTSSYFQETDPIFVAKSASLATTGSNTFIGNQTITGSIYLRSGSVIDSTGADIIIKAGVGNNAGVVLYNNNFTQYLAVDDTGSYANKFSVANNLTVAGLTTTQNQIISGSLSQGLGIVASGEYSHAEGISTQATEYGSHAEGYNTIASGSLSHAEGESTQAIGYASHAEGNATQAIGDYSHTEGDFTQAIGNYSHAEGQETIASGQYSHAEGYNTITSASWQHVQGQWNATSSVPAAFIVGNGTDNNNRSNLIHAAGNEVQISGSIYLGSGSIINESGSTLVLTPPTALPGQSLVIRPTSGNMVISASGFIVAGQTLIITLTSSQFSAASQEDFYYTISGATAPQLGLGSLSGTFLVANWVNTGGNTGYNQISIPIPANSTATTLTLTITGSSMFFGGYSFTNNPITITNNGINNNELSHIHLVTGDPTTVDLYLGDDDQYVKIEKNAGNVVVGTNLNTHQWVFDTSGSFTVPGNINGALNLATTGSNTFIGNQTITGSNGRLIYTGTTLGYPPTLAEVHANDDTPWLERFYNDTFSTSSAIMAYFGWSDGRFVFHNESTQSIGLQVNGYSAENGLLVYSDKVAFINNVEITGSLDAPSITGSLLGTASYAETASYVNLAQTASYIQNAQTASYVLNAVSSSFASTASYLNTLNQNLTFNGNLTLNGTASIEYLNVIYETASIIYSSGSNQFGDATNDTQLLVGRTIVSGSFEVTGSANIPNITGSLLGTASYSNNAATASNILGGKSLHIPFFITDTTLATSSIYQSGSTSIIINQDANTTANPEALYVWQPSTSSFNVISGKGNLNNYLQLNIQNTNQGTIASSDVVATANNGNESTNYIDMGINGENFTGDIGGPNAGYLYSTGQHLHIGNASNYPVQIFAGGFNSDTNRKLQLSPNNYHEMTGSLDISGSLIVRDSITGSLLGTASYANSALSSSYALNADLLDGRDSSVFATTGSNTFIGNQTITGSVFHSGSKFLNGVFVQTGSLTIIGSTTQIGNNILAGDTVLTGSIIISGSITTPSTPTIKIYGDMETDGVIKFMPVSKNIDTSISASYIYVSGSTSDLYFSQNGGGFNNVTRLRWLEGNLYTGLLNGGLITTQSSTVYQVSSGSGIFVNLNASLTDNPYPTIQYVNWPNLSSSIAPLSSSYDQQFVSIQSNGTIYTQGTPYNDGQYNTLIPVGIVIHQNRSTINAFQTFPNVAYGWKQRSSDFIRAFGPLKISGYTLSPSGSSTGSLKLSGGVAWVDGRNYTVDPNNPSYIDEAVGITTSKIYRYHQSGSDWVYNTNGGAGYATIDPSQYSNNGTLTPVGSNDWTIQRVFYFPNSATKAFYVYYGNASYANEAAALAAVNTEPFSEAPNTSANAIYIGFMLLRNNANFTTPTSYVFYATGLFRGSGTSVTSGGGGGSTLAGLADVSITSPTNGQPLVYNTSTLKWQNQSTLIATLTGNASTATSASHATTSSYSETAVTSSYALTASYALNGGGSGTSFPFTGSAIITGSLVVTGSTISTQGFTGSLFGTSSWANNSISSSYVLSSSYAVTASHALVADSVLGSVTNAIYAATSSHADNFTIQGTLALNGTLTDHATVVSSIVGSNNLFTQSTGSRTSAFSKYTLYNGSNARAGEFTTVWNGTTTTYTDTSTTDIGDTTDIIFSSAIISGDIQINAVAASSGWTIKMLTTFI